jgi:glycosyltransferase involved in cell wall biosynthesis
LHHTDILAVKNPISEKSPFPHIGVPIYLSTGHTAHSEEHTGIQRVTRSMARELLESGLRVELIEWVKWKRRYFVLDDRARRKLSRDGGPDFESTESLWLRVINDTHFGLPQKSPPETAIEPDPSSFDENRILRFEAVIRSITHPQSKSPRWIGNLPLPRPVRRKIRAGVRQLINFLVSRSDRRRIEGYIRDILASRKLHNRATRRILKLLEKQRSYAIRLAWKEKEAWHYKQMRESLSETAISGRLKPTSGELETPGIDRDTPTLEPKRFHTGDGSAADLFSFTLRLQPTRFKPVRGAWVVVPELMKPDEMRSVVRYCRARRLNLAVVFHDAIAVTHPELVSTEIRRDFGAFIKYFCRCDLVVAVSRHSADELKAYAEREGIALPNLTVCPNGASFPGGRPIDREPAEAPPVRAICVGTIDLRKNHTTLLKALDLIRRSHPSLDLKVTLVGNAYPGAENLAERVTLACRDNPNLEWKQGVSDEDLRKTYQSCHFTIFPSLLEGFGIPVLESIWHGRPCICSATGAVGEHSKGGGCATVDVTNPNELADAILRLAQDEPYRRRLTNEAKSRVLRTWGQQAIDLVNELSQAAPRYQFIKH